MVSQEKSRIPQNSLTIKNHQDRTEWGTEAGSLGISLLTVWPQKGQELPLPVSMQKVEVWAPHFSLCFA